MDPKSTQSKQDAKLRRKIDMKKKWYYRAWDGFQGTMKENDLEVGTVIYMNSVETKDRVCNESMEFGVEYQKYKIIGLNLGMYGRGRASNGCN